jgi:hypothetical protein
VQLLSVLAEPPRLLLPARSHRLEQSPERFPVTRLAKVAELVHDDVLEHLVGPKQGGTARSSPSTCPCSASHTQADGGSTRTPRTATRSSPRSSKRAASLIKTSSQMVLLDALALGGRLASFSDSL